jgi:hypothetical protein
MYIGYIPRQKNANQPKELLMNCQYPFETHFFSKIVLRLKDVLLECVIGPVLLNFLQL